MTGLALALVGAYGVHLVWTSLAMGWSGLGPAQASDRPRSSAGTVRRWLVQAGLDDVSPLEFLSVTGVLALITALLAFTVFGAALPAMVAGIFAGSFPVALYRGRRRQRRERAQEAWPRIIEEIRILTGSVGRSIPQALFEVGRRAPDELRRGFEAAHREWLITTDFERTIIVLKARLADPTADAACETLLVAHQVGGADLDGRLEALAADRITDLQGRKDARAQQAGVRFARRFVLIVPIGMALAGMSVGNGRSAYQEPRGQLLVVVAIAMILACWIWAGRVMAIPEEDRVFP